MLKAGEIKREKLFEVGKTYQLKILDWKFTITQDPYKRNKDGVILKLADTVYGIHESSPHLGVCPISSERLIPEIEVVDKKIFFNQDMD